MSKDPVVDKSLEEKAHHFVKNLPWSNRLDNSPYADCVKCYVAGAKESKSKAIEDFILELRKELEALPVDRWTAGDLMEKAKELKDKI